MPQAPMLNACATLGTAWRYSACGLAVLPVEVGGKRPVEVLGRRFAWKPIRTPQPPEAVERLFPSDAPRNVGIICGPPSGGLLVLDLDGALTLENVLEALPVLRDTWVVRTGRVDPGPGYHVFVRATGRTPTISGGEFHDALALDVKGTGSYVVGVPSLHSSGSFYRSVRGAPESIVDIGQMRPFLTRLLDGLAVPA